MTATAAADSGRRLAEALMTSTCTIREAPTDATDDETGEVTYTPGAVIYSGRCRLRQPGAWGRRGEAGGVEVSPGSYQVSVPFSVTGLARGQQVTVDSSPDAAAVSRVLTVRESPPLGEHLSARRLICEES